MRHVVPRRELQLVIGAAIAIGVISTVNVVVGGALATVGAVALLARHQSRLVRLTSVALDLAAITAVATLGSDGLLLVLAGLGFIVAPVALLALAHRENPLLGYDHVEIAELRHAMVWARARGDHETAGEAKRRLTPLERASRRRTTHDSLKLPAGTAWFVGLLAMGTWSRIGSAGMAATVALMLGAGGLALLGTAHQPLSTSSATRPTPVPSVT